jgi:hypothetical protein
MVGDRGWNEGAALLGSETGIVLAAAVISGAFAAMLAWLVRNREWEPEDVTIGFLGPSLAAIYLLVLAFALATEWETIGSAQQAVGNEAVAVRQLNWAASGLPAADGDRLRTQVRDYTAVVISHDFPEMAHGYLDDQTEHMLTQMSTFILRINANSSGVANTQQFALGQLSVLASSRAQRENAAESRLPLGVLAAVVATSLIVCVFPFVGGMRQAPWRVVLAIAQTALVTVGVVVVIQLNNPYAGPLGTSPGPLTSVAGQIGAQ